MKQILFIIFLFFVITLFSQFNEPVLIDNPDNPNDAVSYSGQQAYKIIGEKVYITFIQADDDNWCINFGYSENNGNDFTYTVIETIEKNYTEPVERITPVLEVLSNGNVIIFYRDPEESSGLYKAISEDNGQTFTTELIAENVYEMPLLVNDNDNLELCYISGRFEQMSSFQHFTNVEETENADGDSFPLFFWGQDELFGPVHSNGDIWIYNMGGWPTFHEMVTTSGVFQITPGAPMDDIFLGGWQENVPPKLFEPEANLIRENGIQPFDPTKEIVYVKIDGNSYQSMYGDIELVGIDSFKVYSWFPADAQQANDIINSGYNWYEDSDHIWTNYVPIYDTLWTQGPSGTIQDQSVWVESELWIEGQVEGKQTWGCADTVYIVGDITYNWTSIGSAPDDEDNPNLFDYFGLVSEGKILIKYKHKDPFNDMVLREDNCDDIWLYGAYAAIGEGDENTHGELACHYDGIFTFEYQHPHGSTPDFIAPSPYTGNDTLYTYIDFHKYIFPPITGVPPDICDFLIHGGFPQSPYNMCGYPYESPEYIESFPNNAPTYIYPYGTDHPWYNPVWPESAEDIITERGTIHLYGSIAQRRRGYVHRSGIDPYNHPDQNEWDLDNFHYDGTHPSTGYNKDYHYDQRFKFVDLIDFPVTNEDGQNLVITRSTDGGQNFVTQLEQELESPVLGKFIASDGNSIVIALYKNSSVIQFLISEDGINFEEHEFVFEDLFFSFLKSLKIFNNEIYVLVSYYELFQSYENDIILKLNINENSYQVLETFDNNYFMSDFNISNSGEKVYVGAAYDEPQNYVDFHYTNGSDNFSEFYQWLPNFFNDETTPFTSKIAINFNESDSVYVSFLKSGSMSPCGYLYLTSGRLDSLTTKTDEDFDLPEFFISNYPNPFNPEVNISFSLPERSLVKLSIYNLKGQLVKTLINEKYENGNFNIKWNGRNKQNEPVASGVYFYKFESKKFSKIKKILLFR